jgi:hypothetical protein
VENRTGRHDAPPHLVATVTSDLPPFVWQELENQHHFLSSPEPQVEFLESVTAESDFFFRHKPHLPDLYWRPLRGRLNPNFGFVTVDFQNSKMDESLKYVSPAHDSARHNTILARSIATRSTCSDFPRGCKVLTVFVVLAWNLQAND